MKKYLFACFGMILLLTKGVFVNADVKKNLYHPINVLIMVHMEDISGMSGWNRSANPQKTAWQERNENLNWLLKFVSSLPPEKRPKLLLEFNGDFAEKLLESKDPVTLENISLMKRLFKEGFICFGTHPHIVTKTSDGRWIPLRGERIKVNPLKEPEKLRDLDRDEVLKALRAHIEAVDKLCKKITGKENVESINNAIIGALGGRFDTRLKLYSNLLKDSYGRKLPHGFLMETGGERSEPFLALFYHQPWNPFRAGPNGCMDEEVDSDNFVVIPFGGTIGTCGRHMEGWEYTDCSVPARKREFLQLYLEWLYRLKENKNPDKVWVFGFSIHPYNLYSSQDIKNDPIGLKTLREEFVEMIEWLNKHFINKKTKDGYLIAKYSTTYEVYREFIEWEKRHPGESSFEYNQKNTDFSKYPYFLKELTKLVGNSHYVSWNTRGNLNIAEFDVCSKNCIWQKKGDRFICVDIKQAESLKEPRMRTQKEKPPLERFPTQRPPLGRDRFRMKNNRFLRSPHQDYLQFQRGREMSVPLRSCSTEKIKIFWAEEKMEITKDDIVGKNWELINGLTGERIDSNKIILYYIPIIAKQIISEKRFTPGGIFREKEFERQAGSIKKVYIKLKKYSFVGKFNSLNGCYGSGYSPQEGFPHMSERLKEIGIKAMRFPQDDGFNFTLSYIFADDTKPVDDLDSYRFDCMDEYMEEARKVGATLIWTALYDIGGGDFYHPKSGFQGGRCPQFPKKWAKVVRKVVERYNNGWGGYRIVPLDYVECLNEPLGLGGCSPQKYFEVYKYFSYELSDFNKNTHHPVKLVGFGEPIHTEEGDYTFGTPKARVPQDFRPLRNQDNMPPFSRKKEGERVPPFRRPQGKRSLPLISEHDPTKINLFREFVEYVRRNNLSIDAVSIHPYVHGSPYDIYRLTKKYRDEMDALGWSDKKLIITEYGTVRVLVGRSQDFDFISQVLASFQTTTKLFLQGLVDIATGARIMPSGNPKKQKRVASLFFDRYGNKKPAALAVELLSLVEKNTPYISYNLAPNKDNLGVIFCKNRDETIFSLLLSNCSKEHKEVEVEIEGDIYPEKIKIYKIEKDGLVKENAHSLSVIKRISLDPFEVKLFMIFCKKGRF